MVLTHSLIATSLDIMSSEMVALVVLLVCFIAIVAAEGETSFSIEHSMDNGRTYHVRSKFSYDKSKKEIKHTKVTEESELNSLRTLLASDISSLTSTSPATNHSLYQIRTLSNPQDSNSPYIYAAIPACDLQRSGYKEKIVLHFDYKNSIIGLGYSAPIIAKPRDCNPHDVKTNITISTQLETGVIEPAQAIPVVANGIRPPYYGNIKLDVDVDKSNPKGQQTFFQRYWYIMLLIVYYMFRFGGGIGDDEKGATDAKEKKTK